MTVHADVFADALNGTATILLDDTEELLGVVERLHGLPGTAALSNAGARPDFRSELRARLLAEAAAADVAEPHAKVVPITSRWNQSWGRRNRARLLTSAAAGIVIVTAVSIGASNSLPGNPLYPLKRGGESVEYALAGSDEARGKLELSFARTRLNEIGRLTARDSAFGIAPVAGVQAAGGTTILATSTNTWVVRLLGQMDGNAVKGRALLQKSFKDNPRPEPLREVQKFAIFQEAQLTALKSRLAGPALTKATSSLIWATAVVKQTTAALTTCSANTCPAAVAAALSTPGIPPASAAPPASTPPSAAPSAVPSAVPSSPAASAPVVVPTTSLPPTAPVIQAPPQATPTPPVAVPPTAPPTNAPPSPSDTPSQTPTDVTPTPSSPTPSPTPTPSTESPTPDPTTPVPVPPTTPAVPSTPPPATVPPTTAPPVSQPPPTTEPPTTAAPSTEPPVSTTPAEPTPDPPTTTPAPPTTTPAPPTTTPAPPTTPPILICVHPSRLIQGICVRPPWPPGRH